MTCKVFVFVDCITSPHGLEKLNIDVHSKMKKLGVYDYITHTTYILCRGNLFIDFIDAINMRCSQDSTVHTIELKVEEQEFAVAALAFQVGMCAVTCKAYDRIIVYTNSPLFINVLQLPHPVLSHVYAFSNSLK